MSRLKHCSSPSPCNSTGSLSHPAPPLCFSPSLSLSFSFLFLSHCRSTISLSSSFLSFLSLRLPRCPAPLSSLPPLFSLFLPASPWLAAAPPPPCPGGLVVTLSLGSARSASVWWWSGEEEERERENGRERERERRESREESEQHQCYTERERAGRLCRVAVACS